VKLPNPRVGVPVNVSGRAIGFSLWPLQKAPGGYALSRKLFVSDPWPVMRHAILEVGQRSARDAGLAFLEQAQDFFGAATRAHTSASKPLLLYYSFLNLAKALVLVRTPALDLDRAKHGLSESLKPNGEELVDAFLTARPTTPTSPQVFDLLFHACAGRVIANQLILDVPTMMRQIVTGHRLLIDADPDCGERFAGIERAEILHDSKTRTIWLRLAIARTDITDIGVTQTEFLNRSGLGTGWRLVKEPNPGGVKLLWLEQKQPRIYRDTFIGLSVSPLIDDVRSSIWQTAMATPPYRRYYLLASPMPEHPYRLPQILSIYCLLFYLGSITRYRPHHFDRIVDGPYGAFVQSFVHEQPSQLLFLFASEFVQRDVAKPALA
jgi:hypothetical protein